VGFHDGEIRCQRACLTSIVRRPARVLRIAFRADDDRRLLAVRRDVLLDAAHDVLRRGSALRLSGRDQREQRGRQRHRVPAEGGQPAAFSFRLSAFSFQRFRLKAETTRENVSYQEPESSGSRDSNFAPLSVQTAYCVSSPAYIVTPAYSPAAVRT